MGQSFSAGRLHSCLQRFIDLVKDNADLVAVFLFGSYAAGKATLLSDVDVAVLLDRSLTKDEYLPMKLRLMGELSTALGTDQVDLVILNEAPAALGFRITKDGKLVYLREGAKDQLVDYKVRTMDRYFDFQPVQRMFSEGLAKRIREGTFGGG